MNLDSVREVAQALSERGLAPKKRWGQNFLVDGNVRRAIASRVRAGAGDPVWEIGPGVGALTELLLERGVELAAFEIDYGLIALLEEVFPERGNLRIIAGDCVETWPGELERGGVPRSIIGNLPYSQGAVIIASFLEAGLQPEQYLFMVQEEVADRMGAGPGTRTYSAFSVLVQSRLAVSETMRVQPGSFYPRPEVSSTLVELRPRPDAPVIEDTGMLTAVTRAVFHARRKTVLNSIVSSGFAPGPGSADTAGGEAAAGRRGGGPPPGHPGGGAGTGRGAVLSLLEEAGIDPSVRGETLTVERIVALSNLAAARRRRPDSDT